MKAIVKDELMEIRNKYADERKTEIMAVSGEVDIEDLIPQEECVLTLTNFGYVKRRKWIPTGPSAGEAVEFPA